MKYYLDEKEVTLEELEEVRKNLVQEEWSGEILEVCKIEFNALYFQIISYEM